MTETWSPRVTRVLAPNPSPLTLEGTNTFVVAEPAARSVVVIDPGPADDGHAVAVVEAGAGRDVELVLLTHTHVDHAEGARAFADRVAAPLAALAAGWSTAGAPEAERASSASVTAAGPRVRSTSRCSSRPAPARKSPSDRSSAHSSSRALEYANTPSRAYSVSCSGVRRPSLSKRWTPPIVTRPAEGSAGTSRSTGRPEGATTSRTPRYSSSR